MNTFSIEKELIQAWQLVKKDWKFFATLSLVVVLVYGISQFLIEFFKQDAPLLGILLTIISLVIYTILEMGFITIGLNALDGKPKKIADLFRTTKPFWAFIAMSTLYSLMVLIGSFLLILPGIYLYVMGSMAGPLLLERKLGPIEAIKQSFRITKGHFWKLLWFSIVLTLINILGVLLLGVGLLLSMPVTLIALLSVYRKLASHQAS
ncbi:MAG: hypothetical protein AAB337_02990 [Patescibacteria group bacterium]